VERFIATRAGLEDYWRAVILFGRNVATFKFALGQSLLELGDEGRDFVTLEEVAEPFSRHLCEHPAQVDRQGTSPPGDRLGIGCRGERGPAPRADGRLLVTYPRADFQIPERPRPGRLHVQMPHTATAATG